MSNLIQAIRMQSPETIPVGINLLPAAWLKYGSELQRLIDQYPQFFGGRQVDLEHILDGMVSTYHKGTHVDEWGCVWENEIDGAEAIVKGQPVKTEEKKLESAPAPAPVQTESAQPAAEESQPAAVAPAPAPAAPAAETTTYVVQEGDDMTGVSIRWGVSAAAIRELNNLNDGDQLKPGQIIKLPAEAQQ